MPKYQQLYMYITGLAAVLIIFGELIWVLDPIRLNPDLYWLDLVEYFIYLCILIPLGWAIGALLGIIKDRTDTNGLQKFIVIFLKLVILITSFSVIAFVLFAPTHLLGLGISIGLAYIFVILDILLPSLLRKTLPIKGIVFTAISIVIFGFLLWPTNYLVTYPGMTLNMNQYAHADGGKVKGEISGVLVFERPAFPVDWLYAVIFPHYEFEKKEKLGMSLEEYSDVVQVMKEDANTVASAVAFDTLGIGEGITSQGVLIVSIMKDSAVEGKLKAGDVIVKIGEDDIRSIEDLTKRMEAVNPYEEILITVVRDSEERIYSIVTKADEADEERAVLGVQITNNVSFDPPLEVRFHEYLLHHGGPSHGAMLALTIIDQLTPGGVTFGNRIAGTGTISLDGTIGPIGSIEQKAYTVQRAGADVFFVPAGQEEEARKGSDQLQIVPVQHLQDILDWLKEHPNGDENIL